MKKRKTIDVEYIKTYVNYALHNSLDNYQDGREALQTLLECVLLKTGNYKGFGYLSKDYMEKSVAGTTVGINDAGLPVDKLFANTDPSRVKYL